MGVLILNLFFSAFLLLFSYIPFTIASHRGTGIYWAAVVLFFATPFLFFSPRR